MVGATSNLPEGIDRACNLPALKHALKKENPHASERKINIILASSSHLYSLKESHRHSCPCLPIKAIVKETQIPAKPDIVSPPYHAVP